MARELAMTMMTSYLFLTPKRCQCVLFLAIGLLCLPILVSCTSEDGTPAPRKVRSYRWKIGAEGVGHLIRCELIADNPASLGCTQKTGCALEQLRYLSTE